MGKKKHNARTFLSICYVYKFEAHASCAFDIYIIASSIGRNYVEVNSLSPCLLKEKAALKVYAVKLYTLATPGVESTPGYRQRGRLHVSVVTRDTLGF